MCKPCRSRKSNDRPRHLTLSKMNDWTKSRVTRSEGSSSYPSDREDPYDVTSSNLSPLPPRAFHTFRVDRPNNPFASQKTPHNARATSFSPRPLIYLESRRGSDALGVDSPSNPHVPPRARLQGLCATLKGITSAPPRNFSTSYSLSNIVGLRTQRRRELYRRSVQPHGLGSHPDRACGIGCPG